VEPSAVAARRTRASLALAVGGALFLMSGIALTLIAAALRLEQQVPPVPLVTPGLTLAILGVALGAAAMVTILLDAPTRMPLSFPESRPAEPSAAEPSAAEPAAAQAAAGPAAAQAAAGPAWPGETVRGEVLSSDVLPQRPPAAPVTRPEVVPGAPLSPPGRPGPGPVPSAREPMASEVLAGEVLAGYSDAGWKIEAAEPGPQAGPPHGSHDPAR
jgi:hypothetical protein